MFLVSLVFSGPGTAGTAETAESQQFTGNEEPVETEFRVSQGGFTLMLSFCVLIGLHKVPELLLALLSQELAEG